MHQYSPNNPYYPYSCLDEYTCWIVVFAIDVDNLLRQLPEWKRADYYAFPTLLRKRFDTLAKMAVNVRKEAETATLIPSLRFDFIRFCEIHYNK